MTKALSITLILGLLLSSLALSSGLSESLNTIAQALTTEGCWTDYEEDCDTSWYYGHDEEGSEENPYLIGTAKELAGLAYLVNNGTDNFTSKVIKFTADIDLGEHYWVPIGLADMMDDDNNPINVFKGTFDGLYGEEETHTIKNMLIGTEDNPAEYEYAGLFGYVEDATIKSVNIDESCKIYNDRYYIGGICGEACNTTINKCTNSGTVCSNGNDKSTRIGGICGWAAYNTIISNCTNKGTVSSESNNSDNSNDYTSSHTGGICGFASDETNISNCINTGNVSSSEGHESRIGGICGEGGFGKSEVNNCTNNGNISSNGNVVSYIGGIYGETRCSTISNCANSGTISSDSDRSNVGGICGFASCSTMSNCSNSGAISSSSAATVLISSYVGGICGKTYNKTTIINCTNGGTISHISNPTETTRNMRVYIGGICGDAYNQITISNCTNSGNVSHISNSTETTRTVRVYLGGICGAAHSDSSTISNCTNSGNVSHISNSTETTRNAKVYVGGICSLTLHQLTISNCINSGDVSSNNAANSTVGGICGYYANDEDDNDYKIMISNSYYQAGAAPKGIGNLADNNQEGTTALPEGQMKAAAGATAEDDWVEIDGIGTVALVDALNRGVKNLKDNGIENINYWAQRNEINNNYPYINNSWLETDADGNYLYIDTTWYDPANPDYTISTAAELAGLAKLVNIDGIDFKDKTIALGDNDIKLGAHTWEPIGTEENPFKGIFNGNDKTIDNINIINICGDVGLFGCIEEAIIEKVTIGENSYIYNSVNQFCAGGIVSQAFESTIKECTNKATIIISPWYVREIRYTRGIRESYAGGIAAIIFKTTIENCVNDGNISVGQLDSYAGGIVAKVIWDEDEIQKQQSLIKNCVNNGNVSTIVRHEEYRGWTAGIVAMSSHYNTESLINLISLKIENCVNNGDISSVNNIGKSIVAGITAGIYRCVDITDCNNYGKINATNSLLGIAIAGGIVAQQTTFLKKKDVTVTNCNNYGEVLAKSSPGNDVPNIISSGAVSGGILGCANGGVILNNCANNANIASDSQYFSYAVGVVAIANNTAINNCHNNFALETHSMIGYGEDIVDVVEDIIGINFGSTKIDGEELDSVNDLYSYLTDFTEFLNVLNSEA